MDSTRVTQECQHVVDSSGQLKYRIRTSVDPSNPGELPHFQIFVYSVGVEDDPTTDTFVRVATPHDLQSYPKDRNDALGIDVEGLFLMASMEVYYDDLSIAIQAKSAITSRINNLVNTWIAYKDAFYTDPESETFHPTVDPTLEQQLKDAYSTARNARITAEAALTVAESAVTEASSAIDAATEIVQIREAEVQFCTTTITSYWSSAQSQFNTFVTAAEAYKTASKIFLENDIGKDDSHGAFEDLVDAYNETINGDATQWSSFPTDPAKVKLYNAINDTFNVATGKVVPFLNSQWATFNAAYEQWIAAAPVLDQLGTTFQDFCRNAAAGYASALSAKSAAEDTYNDSVKEKEKAEAELAAAQTAEDTALAAAQDVCPDFDPLSA